MTRMVKAEDLDEGQSGNELKKAARKNIALEAEIIRLKEEAASNAVRLLAVDNLEQSMAAHHKTVLDTQRREYEEEVKQLREDLEKDRAAMRHLESTLKKLHESRDGQKRGRGHSVGEAEEDLLLQAEAEAHALVEVMNEEINEARALAVTHGHGTDEDKAITDENSLDKAARDHATETVESNFDFASPFARHKNAPVPPDMDKPGFAEGIVATIREVFVEKLRVDEHDVELGLDPQPFAVVFRDVMTHRHGETSVILDRKIREFVAAALEMADRHSVLAKICNLLGVSKHGTDDVYSQHIGDALFDLFGAVCEQFWEPGIQHANAKVGKRFLIYPETECILDKKHIMAALDACEALTQYLDPEAMKLMRAHIEYAELKEPGSTTARTSPRA